MSAKSVLHPRRRGKEKEMASVTFQVPGKPQGKARVEGLDITVEEYTDGR